MVLNSVVTSFCEQCNFFCEVAPTDFFSCDVDLDTGKISYKGFPNVTKKNVIDAIKEIAGDTIKSCEGEIDYLSGQVSCKSSKPFKHICTESRRKKVEDILIRVCKNQKKDMRTCFYNPAEGNAVFLRMIYRGP